MSSALEGMDKKMDEREIQKLVKEGEKLVEEALGLLAEFEATE